MAYKQNPLKYSRTSNMPGVEFADEDISMKERLATNAFGVEPPADLLDGEFFLKDNDPQDFYRTLYIKRGESLDKVVTFTDTGKAIFDGVNEINLDDDEEVKGVLPKRKIITASATVPMDNIQNIVAYDGSKFQEVAKADFIAEKAKLADNATNSINAELSELSKDIKYNIIDENSPITDVKDLPFGWSIIAKELNNMPDYTNFIPQNRYPVIHKYKIKNGGIDTIYDFYSIDDFYYVLYTQKLARGILRDDSFSGWYIENDNLDISIATKVSQVGTFSASNTVLVEENGEIKKVNKSELIKALKQELSDITLPVGFIYIQLRGQSTPDELFGSSSKWQDVSAEYAGEFFRAVGGNSAAFGSKQAEGLPNITGMISSFVSLFNFADGAFNVATKYQDRASSTPDSNHYHQLGFNASNSNSIYGASTHVTPYNSAVRIWKKIA